MRNLKDMWPRVRHGEKVVGYYEPLEGLEGGDLIGWRFGVLGSGRNQVLVVATIDGYGGKDPICWKAYSLPELECEPVRFDDLYDADSYRIKINTFSDVREFGDEVPEDEARRIFPYLADLRYGR